MVTLALYRFANSSDRTGQEVYGQTSQDGGWLAEQMAEVRKAVIGEVQRVIASLENQYNARTNQEMNSSSCLTRRKLP